MVAAVVGLGLAASLLLGVSVQAASAQSMSLAQLVNLFISLGIIPADKAAAAQAAITGSSTTAPASSYVFNNNLTVGSTGADVTALQNCSSRVDTCIWSQHRILRCSHSRQLSSKWQVAWV